MYKYTLTVDIYSEYVFFCLPVRALWLLIARISTKNAIGYPRTAELLSK